MKRRDFIKGSALTSGSVIAATISQKSYAAWDKLTYQSPTAKLAIERKFNKGSNVAKAKNIIFKIPRIAQNSLTVPITVDARKREDVKSIAIIIDANPQPMVAFASFTNKAEAFISTRVKMTRTSKVRAILDTNSGLEEISRPVKVRVG